MVYLVRKELLKQGMRQDLEQGISREPALQQDQGGHFIGLGVEHGFGGCHIGLKREHGWDMVCEVNHCPRHRTGLETKPKTYLETWLGARGNPVFVLEATLSTFG